MAPRENGGARKKNDPTRDGRDGSPSRPSKEFGGLGSLPIHLATVNVKHLKEFGFTRVWNPLAE
ncbi:MAG: hypothetical protein WCH98_01330 [Verrucomicrobiota bacterium]